jgi:phage nucleotide-binding protein
MAISLKNLLMRTASLPARILIYGEPGIGKTTLPSTADGVVYLPIEDGIPAGLKVRAFDKPRDFKEVMECLQALYEEEHDYKTLVVDSISELQRLVFDETCARGDEKGNKKNNIEDFGYGKGYVYAERVLHEFIDGINLLRSERGITIVLLAHSRIERFDDPESSSYDRYCIDLHQKLVTALEREMDAILLLKRAVTVKKEEEGFNKSRAIAEGGRHIFLHSEGRPAYVAKNRYDIPDKIKIEKTGGWAAIAPYLPGYEAPKSSKKDAA